MLCAGMTMIVGLCSVPARAQEKLTVRLDFLPHGMHTALYLAQEKGWYKARGVEPTFDDGNGSVPAIQLVGQGKYDIGHVSLGAMVGARDKGIPVKAIAGILRKGDVGVLAGEDTPIHAPKDLEGKVVYFSPGSFETQFIDIFFARAGVDKSKVKLSSLDIGAKVSTYLAGKGDAMFSPVPLYTIREKIPRLSRGFLFADYGIVVPGFGLIASEDGIQQKPKAIAGFIAAVQQSWDAIRTSGAIDEGVAALIKNRPNAKLDPVIVKQQVQAVLQYFDTDATKGRPTLWQAETDWAQVVKAMEEANVIKPGSQATDYFTNQFVPGS
jgi:NitT/TauT family transport system substrate-binding protein